MQTIGNCSWEEDGGPDGWARLWTKSGSGWEKGSTLYPATRGNSSVEDTTEASRAAGADSDGWIHLIYGRRGLPPNLAFFEGDPPTLNFWTNGDRDIYYVTHHEEADPEEWGWEIPLVDVDTVAVYYAGIAANESGVHVLYSQYNPEEENLDVFYLEGEDIGNSVVSGDSAVWDGTVFLDDTFTVEAGGKLTIAAGTTVYAQTPEDVVTGPLVELVVRGQLRVEGTSEDPVRFASTKNEEAGEWGGITFDLAGSLRPGYGYAGCAGPLSSMANARIENALYGIVVEDYCAPSLESVEFANISQDRHIFLKSDTMIPYGYWADVDSFVVSPATWDLGGGTHVVADTAVTHDATWVGTSGKNDLVAYGKLFTDGSDATGDQVFFEPSGITPLGQGTAGADWGGILLSSWAAGSVLKWADIGYAENPLFMYYPDSLTKVEDSTIHAFADVGIWVVGSKGQGGVINRCTVDRDSTLHASLGGTGIYLDQADEINVLDTVVWLHKLDDTGGGTGLAIRYGKTLCQTTPPSARSLLLQGNFVIGPGRSAPENGTDYTGITADWVCGSLDRDIDILSNWVSRWKNVGMEYPLSGKLDRGLPGAAGTRPQDQVLVRGDRTFCREVPRRNGVHISGLEEGLGTGRRPSQFNPTSRRHFALEPWESGPWARPFRPDRVLRSCKPMLSGVSVYAIVSGGARLAGAEPTPESHFHRRRQPHLPSPRT